MINNKNDYIRYLETDRLVTYITRKRPRPFVDEIRKYTRTMRKLEYYDNCKKGYLIKFIKTYLKFKLHRLSIKTQFSIPPHVFEEGLTLFHHGTIVVNERVKVGKYCQLHCCTNIADGVQIGDHVFIGPGAIIMNDVKIAIAGAPARKVSNIGTNKKIVKKKDGKYFLEITRFQDDAFI